VAVVRLHDLVVQGRHGVFEPEKQDLQPFAITLELHYDSTVAQHSDKIEDALDYGAVRQTVIDIVQSTSFNLIERLAQEIVDQLLQDARIEQLTISIEKPAVFESGIPGVTLTISRPK
jgi:dihydroneopterin aldolase